MRDPRDSGTPPTETMTAAPAGATPDPAAATETTAPAGDVVSPGPGDPPGRPARREMTLAVVLALAGAGLVLAVAGRPWAHGTAVVHGARLSLEVTGNAVGKGPSGLALLGLAGALAVFATRGAGRVVVGALVALAGAGIAALAVAGARDTSALDSAAAGKAAVEGVKAVGVSHTTWPWLAVAGGVVLLAAGLIVAVRGRHWPGMSSRYEAPAAGAARRRGPATNADLWNALDRGEDPTR